MTSLRRTCVSTCYYTTVSSAHRSCDIQRQRQRCLKIWDSGQSRSLKLHGTIRKLMYGFLFAFHSNYGRIFIRLDTIHERVSQPPTQPPHDGIDAAYA